jgi:exopolyphosphatase/guanosine-5'-triphosphate,3'-diphosphate pyrophosphatase
MREIQTRSPSVQGAGAASALCAAIDVGTNSVKLTIADLTRGAAPPVFDQSVNTRLGEGMTAQAHWLHEAPIRRTLDALAAFVALAREHGVSHIAAVGTAALREAENRADFLRRAQERCDLTIDVISGEEEARLSFLAVRRDPHWRSVRQLLVVDIGGGSTEIIQGETDGDGIAARKSVRLGAVRLTEGFLKSDPPTIAQLTAANRAADEALAAVEVEAAFPNDPAQTRLVGVGGTLTNLGAMDLNRITSLEAVHGHVLTADHLEAEIKRLASSPIEVRKQIPGLDPKRADIILGGAILLSQALARIGSASIDISTRGLRWGVLYDRFAEREEERGKRDE